MFTESDEIFIWAKKGKKNKVFVLATDAEVKSRFVEIFNNGITSLLQDGRGEEKDCLPFESNYTIKDGEENFIISAFKIPQELKDAIDAPDVIERYVPTDEKGKTADGYDIRAIIFGAKKECGYCFAGQKFSQRQVVIKPRGLNLFYRQDMFIEEKERFSINIGETVDCIYKGTGLMFEKYSAANGVFDLSEYYREASQDEVDAFSSNKAFEIEDVDAFAHSVEGISMRKKIAKIIDLKTLDDVTKIRVNASKVHVDIEFTDDNKVKIPNDKKKLKKILAFLAEELYPGLFTNNTYLTNSTRQVDW